MGAPLRITFVLPFLSFTGGVRVVFEHTRQLASRGHQVRIVAPSTNPALPLSRDRRERLRSWAVERFIDRPSRVLDYFGIAECVTRVAGLDGSLFPDGDVLIATSWPTAGPVAGAPERCGRGAYFLQHYEVFHPGEEESVDATWRLPLERIVISTWLADIARDRFGLETHGPVMNGINQEQFHDRGRRSNDPLVIGMLYELQPWKGVDDGFEAIRLARRSYPGLRIRMFGRYRLRHKLREGDVYIRNPDQAKIGDIYRGCDLFLSPSHSEGWGLPAQEAMACGCAVVATDIGGIRDYAVPGETVLTAPPGDPARLATRIETLAGDSVLRRKIAESGKEYTRNFTWEAATDRLEKCLLEIVSSPGAQRNPRP